MAEPTQPIAANSDSIASEDRTLAIMAHLAGLAGYIVPFGGVIVPIIIWIAKSEDRVISAIAKQAVVLNVVVFVLGLVLILPLLTVVLIPLSIIGWIALALIALALPIIGAVKASEGEYYSYPGLGIRP